jgi:hypothetical protein
MGHAWLWRLEATEWVDAAKNELELGKASIDTRRRAITHARRAAGMSINGVLVTMRDRGWPDGHCESVWGRSYLEHLRALAEADDIEPFAPAVAELASDLLGVPVMPGDGLVRLGAQAGGDAARALQLAQRIVEACQTVVDG